MFSSNPFQQQLPSSIHVFPPSNSFFDLEKDGVHFNHHNHHHHQNHQFAPPPASVTGQQQLSKESGFHYCDDNSNLLDSVIYPSKRKMSNMKKDGHSKIHTAQGPRDRRVRLSIEVARKFFYLQDLLGFDKASKTLDWLFTKSKNSIKELVEEMKLHCSSSDANDQCEVFQDTVKRGLVEEEDKGLQKKSATSKYFEGRKKLKMTRKNKSGVDVNQSRAEARARARERTKEKMQNKKLDVESKKALDDSYRVINPSNVTFQTSFWSQNESVMEQKVSSSLLYGYQHNHQLLVSSDLSSEIRTRPEREINHWVVNSDLSAATRFGNPRPPRSNLFDEAS